MSLNGELRKSPAPDGGWGWVVLTGVTIQTTIYITMPVTFGLIFKDFFEEKQLGTQGLVLLSSILLFTSSVFGLFSNYSIIRWGYRKCALICALLQVAGSLITVFVQEFWQLLLFYGFIPGIGGGILFIIAFCAFNDYWDKRRSFTMSLLQLISGVIAIAAPLFIEFLMSNYGFRGTLLITSGLFGNLLPIALIYRSVESPSKSSHFVQDKEEIIKNSLLSQINEIFDLTLLRDPVTLNVLVGVTLITFADYMLITIQPIYLMHIGHSRGDTALCLTAGALADVLGRLTLTIIGYLSQFNNRTVVLLGTISGTIFRIGFMFVDNFIPVLLFSSLLGFTRALISVPLTLTIADHVAQERFSAALGFYNFFFGTCVLLLSPIIGAVRDWTGSYAVAIHLLSGISFIVIILWILEKYLYKGSNISKKHVKDNP